jgi:Ca2+-binding RTX toxin-like protein
MTAALGNDTYVVDNAGDVVTEALNAGHRHGAVVDQLHAGANVENLTLTGSANINGTGNASPTHHRQQRQQHARRRRGADTMIGGLGNDTYVVDNAGDVVDGSAQRGHRHGAVVGQLHARRQCREPDPDRQRQHQRHRQRARQRIIGNSGNNTLDGGAAPTP